MRDPKRIEETLSVLRKIWYSNPDLRLGQIIVNAETYAPGLVDLFYMEDDLLLSGLKTLLKKGA